MSPDSALTLTEQFHGHLEVASVAEPANVPHVLVALYAQKKLRRVSRPRRPEVDSEYGTTACASRAYFRLLELAIFYTLLNRAYDIIMWTLSPESCGILVATAMRQIDYQYDSTPFIPNRCRVSSHPYDEEVLCTRRGRHVRSSTSMQVVPQCS